MIRITAPYAEWKVTKIRDYCRKKGWKLEFLKEE